MCLPDFIEFQQINEENALTGYRNWKLSLNNLTRFKSETIDFQWNKVIEGPHEVLDSNSGIYAYNNNYYNNNNNNYDNNNNYNYNNNNYNYNYYAAGIIKQWGKTGIHKIGQRSEFAKIDILFTIRESDAKGPDKFLSWIKQFNRIIEDLAKFYECKTMSWQDRSI